MANTGNTFPQTGENVDRAGLTAWTNPGNIVSDNTTDATCNGTGSDYLVARNFGFAVPTGDAIQGILVRVEASEHSAGTEPLLAQLQDDTATLAGNAKSTSNEGSVSGTAKAVYTYGSTSDAWGATLTPAIVNDPDFGVRLWFATAHDMRIDYVTVAIEHASNITQKSATLSVASAGTVLEQSIRRRRPSSFTTATVSTLAMLAERLAGSVLYVVSMAWQGASTLAFQIGRRRQTGASVQSAATFSVAPARYRLRTFPVAAEGTVAITTGRRRAGALQGTGTATILCTAGKVGEVYQAQNRCWQIILVLSGQGKRR